MGQYDRLSQQGDIVSLAATYQGAVTTHQVDALHGLNLEADKDYLLFSVFDIDQAFPPTSNTKNYLAVSYDEKTSAEDVMNKVARWIKNSDAFNQYATHKEDWERYALMVYDLPGKEMEWDRADAHPDYKVSLVGDIRLADHLLSGADIRDFDDFMRTLDRDEITHQVRLSVHLILDEPGKPLPGKAAYSGKPYENDIRAASHPDARWVALHSQTAQPAAM